MKKRHKIFKREAVLGFLAEAGIATSETIINLVTTTAQLGAAMVNSPDVASRALRREIVPVRLDKLRSLARNKIRLHSLLSKLKREGMINRVKKGAYNITEKGRKYLLEKKSRFAWSRRYTVEKTRNNILTIVVFDVPEHERAKRDWLRYELILMSFKKLQNSVWVGNYTLPSEFITDLQSYNILPYVHIFSVDRKGTITDQ
ncbi:hypothetical protein A3I25_00040 [Candidatus Nomurabacteria bacterium RIFCSPLOWO2_02_FULL_42_17]|uniref:Transcriptional repressor PaaX-like central Cas2-like domain-containing protein n=2 Tax=Candidatus Nomuraibacteriota TaxID=1752729 RepID=A0A1F6WHM3_9BACT|nr:MAG: hypothetical protein UV08_C0022G0002 [Parcubacteria group bacterium GW2011_GWA2_42_18]OGI81401.1 MAG: hypothetical protein A3B93_01725 [Candidatus Nomurabacteria bacterium RIFCSPHIGHO2_02_FULL_42_24]OGI96408.1 MAG: hypothetical protein A3I25_00040 [Candidatus Nomurabacteria bacterium RIFCSPLOWO2_02_FULL_42_17]